MDICKKDKTMPTSPLLRYLACSVLFLMFATTPLWSQWERLPGPFGGHVQQFARDGNDLYTLTWGGVYKSSDNGANWNLLENAGLPATYNYAAKWYNRGLHVDAGKIVMLSRDNTLLHSADGGLSWKTVLDILQSGGKPNEFLTGCFIAGDTLFASTTHALYRSLNAGVSWEKVPDPDYYGTLQVVAKIKNAYVGRRGYSIQVSTDGGWVWKNVFTIGPLFASVAVVDTTIFGMYSKYARLIRSENLGLSWEKYDTDSIRYSQDFGGLPGWLTQSGGDLFFGIGYGCYPRVFRSPDRGETWFSTDPNSLMEQQLRDLAGTENGLLAGTPTGIFRSTDKGNTFSPSHTGMNAAQVSNLFQATDGKWWVVAQQGVFRSANQGQNWEEVFPADPSSYCNADQEFLSRTANRMFYFRRYNYPIFVSEDLGNTWSSPPPWPHTDWPQYFHPHIATTRSAAWFIGYDGLVYRWRDSDPAPTPYNMPLLNNVSSLAAADETLYMYGNQKIFISADEGVNWQEVPPLQVWNGNPEFGHYFSMDRHAMFRTGGMLDDSIFMFDYTDNAWRPYFPVDATTGDTFDQYDIRMLRYAGGVRWMGITGRGLYYASLQEPDRWYPYQPVLPAVSPLSIHLAGNEIWAGTAEAGIFRTPLQLRMPEDAAPRFSLYPNPGSGETLQLASDQFFTEALLLRVFDAAGRLVHEQTLPPGQFWKPDVPVLPGGMYALQVKSANSLTALKWIRQR